MNLRGLLRMLMQEHTSFVVVLANSHAIQIHLMGYDAKSADPDQTPLYTASDQGLHCLFTVISMQNNVTTKNPLGTRIITNELSKALVWTSRLVKNRLKRVYTQGINESANFRFLQRLSVIFGFRRDCP